MDKEKKRLIAMIIGAAASIIGLILIAIAMIILVTKGRANYVYLAIGLSLNLVEVVISLLLRIFK